MSLSFLLAAQKTLGVCNHFTCLFTCFLIPAFTHAVQKLICFLVPLCLCFSTEDADYGAITGIHIGKQPTSQFSFVCLKPSAALLFGWSSEFGGGGWGGGCKPHRCWSGGLQ